MKSIDELRITSEELLNYDKFLKKMDLIDSSLQETVFPIIQDPLVRQTKWLPCNQLGNANFCSHVLKVVSAQRLEFQATNQLKIFSLVFVAFGIVTAVLQFSKGVPSGGQIVGALAVCGFFVGIGCYILMKQAVPFVFDIGRGVFWRGQRPDGVYSSSSRNRISDIYALQLIPVCNQKSKRSPGYYSYELNLVLSDGKRVAVANHGDRNRLTLDAKKAATALKKPLWDLVDVALAFHKALQSRVS